MIKDDIARLIHEAAQDLGMMIYEFSIYLKGENTKLTIRIDKLDGVSHKDCEMYSSLLSDKLDSAQIVANYSLEVSSPGINRKIRDNEEFARFINAPVKLVVDREDLREAIKGILKAVDRDGVTISTEKEEMIVSFKNISQANLDY